MARAHLQLSRSWTTAGIIERATFHRIGAPDLHNAYRAVGAFCNSRNKYIWSWLCVGHKLTLTVHLIVVGDWKHTKDGRVVWSIPFLSLHIYQDIYLFFFAEKNKIKYVCMYIFNQESNNSWQKFNHPRSLYSHYVYIFIYSSSHCVLFCFLENHWIFLLIQYRI